MIREPQILRDFLAAHPEAWPARMALIEELVRDGKLDEARLVIRESPPDCEMPADYQGRIHIAMTRGTEGVNSLSPLPGFEARSSSTTQAAPSSPKPEKDALSLSDLAADDGTAESKSLSRGSRALAESSAGEPVKPQPQLPSRATPRDDNASPIGRAPGNDSRSVPAGDDAAAPPEREPRETRDRFSDSTTELSRPAIVFVGIVLVTFIILFRQGLAMTEASWQTINGDLIVGTAVEFDPETKMVTFENEEKVRTTYPTEDFDFAGKQRLFFSSVFWKVQLDEGVAEWSPEKSRSYGFLFVSLLLLLISCMWVAGFVIARRRNPLVAAMTCCLGWLIGFILLGTYSIFAERFASADMRWIGVVVALAVVAMLVSSLYLISYIKGLLIFISHAALFGIFTYLLVFQADNVFPVRRASLGMSRCSFRPGW